MGKNQIHPKETYHHGALAEELLTLALDQVRRGGAQSVSLRELAKAAGVTPAAAYRHYADKDELLSAVAGQGFELFAQLTRRRSARRSGRARLLAIGVAYVEFAAENPHLFHLMFSEIGSRRGDRHSPTMNGNAFDQLRSALSDLGAIAPEDVDPALLAHAWAVAHGAAALVCSGVWSRNDPRALASLSSVVDYAERTLA